MGERTRFERRVVEAILEGGVPLARLAEQTGVARDAISRFVNGKAGLSSGSLGKILDHLGWTLVEEGRIMPTPSPTPSPKPSPKPSTPPLARLFFLPIADRDDVPKRDREEEMDDIEDDATWKWVQRDREIRRRQETRNDEVDPNEKPSG